MTDEKRLYPRLSLTLEDGYFGHFTTADQQTLVASIVNLSVGGINIVVAKADQDKIKEGDTLTLIDIAGNTQLSFLSDVIGQIRWIKDLGVPKFVSVGCRFEDLPEPSREQISRFVDTERRTRGQYN
ncbi:MAG: PilZ domain-containing protein [Desulfatitalea sp.]|nr:PilZ domain-containing protein [Desulfatitalea sp.]NNK00080.1 PilZ domain-containing protein [Desulfatitalea sp.]